MANNVNVILSASSDQYVAAMRKARDETKALRNEASQAGSILEKNIAFSPRTLMNVGGYAYAFHAVSQSLTGIANDINAGTPTAEAVARNIPVFGGVAQGIIDTIRAFTGWGQELKAAEESIKKSQESIKAARELSKAERQLKIDIAKTDLLTTDQEREALKKQIEREKYNPLRDEARKIRDARVNSLLSSAETSRAAMLEAENDRRSDLGLGELAGESLAAALAEINDVVNKQHADGLKRINDDYASKLKSINESQRKEIAKIDQENINSKSRNDWESYKAEQKRISEQNKLDRLSLENKTALETEKYKKEQAEIKQAEKNRAINDERNLNLEIYQSLQSDLNARNKKNMDDEAEWRRMLLEEWDLLVSMSDSDSNREWLRNERKKAKKYYGIEEPELRQGGTSRNLGEISALQQQNQWQQKAMDEQISLLGKIADNTSSYSTLGA